MVSEINGVIMNGTALLLENDIDIVEEYTKSKSERSANSFVRKYRSFVYSTALRYLGNHDDADDCAQEVFLKALKSLRNFRKESNLKTWLYRITVNHAINQIRKKKVLAIFNFSSNESTIEFETDVLNPEDDMINQEFIDKFYKSLAKLPEKQRETFALKYFDELKYEEISEVLGTSVGGLKANYYQAVKKLSALLKNEVNHE